MLLRPIKRVAAAFACCVVLAGSYALTTRLLPASMAAPAPAVSVLTVEPLASGLIHPWSLAFLPDGSMLVTERPGRLRLVMPSGEVKAPITGLPTVVAVGQGGLLDVVLDPAFASNRRIWLSYSEPRDGGRNGTAVASATLLADRLAQFRVVFRQQPSWNSSAHFGSRLAWGRDGFLYVTLGERYAGKELAQTLDNTLGKVVRIDREGQVPADNPFVGTEGALPEIWTYGHRNPQGLAVHPVTGEIWELEHGPKGGDELNLLVPGRNYGWPVISYGVGYDYVPVGSGESAQAGMEQPVFHWTPSIAPSGLVFYNGGRFTEWHGNAFVGSLKFGLLVRLEMEGGRVLREHRYDIGARIRDVREGPDGWLYLLTDEDHGRILRVGPRSVRGHGSP